MDGVVESAESFSFFIAFSNPSQAPSRSSHYALVASAYYVRATRLPAYCDVTAATGIFRPPRHPPGEPKAPPEIAWTPAGLPQCRREGVRSHERRTLISGGLAEGVISESERAEQRRSPASAASQHSSSVGSISLNTSNDTD